MGRKVTLTWDREGHGSWPYVASTAMPNAKRGELVAAGPTEEAALLNLKRVVNEHLETDKPPDYPKVVEVDW